MTPAPPTPRAPGPRPEALQLEWVTRATELDALRPAWTALDDGSAPGAVFRSWEWQATWWRILGARGAEARGGGARELRVLVARDAGGPRALLPLYAEETRVARFTVRRRLGFLGDGVVGSDYLGLVAAAGDAARLAAPIARHLAAERAAWARDVVELGDLLDGDPLSEALAAALAEAGAAVELRPRYRCPFARLAGLGLDDYLAARPGHFGAQLARRRRRLAREPGYRLEAVAAPAAIGGALEALLALHRARWAAEGGSEAIVDRHVEDFHRQAGALLAARGLARAAVLSVGGRPVAAGYGFARAGRFAYYQAGLDPAWRRLSAGTVVLGALLERAFAEGLEEFDFLRGDEPYKAIWADAARTTHAVVARVPSVRGRLRAPLERAERIARALAHRVLPGRAVTGVRRALRRLERRARAGERGAA